MRGLRVVRAPRGAEAVLYHAFDRPHDVVYVADDHGGVLLAFDALLELADRGGDAIVREGKPRDDEMRLVVPVLIRLLIEVRRGRREAKRDVFEPPRVVVLSLLLADRPHAIDEGLKNVELVADILFGR